MDSCVGEIRLRSASYVYHVVNNNQLNQQQQQKATKKYTNTTAIGGVFLFFSYMTVVVASSGAQPATCISRVSTTRTKDFGIYFPPFFARSSREWTFFNPY